MRRTTSTGWLAAALFMAAARLAGACGPKPIPCEQGMPSFEDGAPCAKPGDFCDSAGTTCTFYCRDDLLWHEECYACPDDRPTAGGACDHVAYPGDCSYPPETSCGPGSGTVLDCDAMTSTWIESDAEPCVTGS
jgi:hypothetical protein